jgi:tetratricopeptide (TPR) repeat protein
MTEESTPEEAETTDAAAMSEAEQAMVDAAREIDFVVLPLACVNEGRGAPLGMGVQRWWAQEITRAGARAAAPVFTAMADQGGRQVPALMVYRDAWTEEQIREGVARFENAKHALVTEFHVAETGLKLSTRLLGVSADGFEEGQSWSFEGSANELPEKLFGILKQIASSTGRTVEHADAKTNFGTENEQAMLSFLVGLGNLSALQGRCVPATSDQLLNPLMDALQRDPQMDATMEALHAMVDILVQGQPDRSSVPLSVQAMSIAAQRREKDPDAWHHLALIARRLGDLPTAVNAFNNAFNLAPESSVVAVNFIGALRSGGDTENALKVAKFAAERGNDDPAVLALLGGLLIETDDFDSAEPFLRRAVDEGQIPSAYGDLANVLWDRADPTGAAGKEDRGEAMDLLRTASKLEQVAKSTLDMLLDLFEDDDVDEARELLMASAESHPQSPAVLTAAANLYIDNEEPEKARPFLEQILQVSGRSLDDDAFARRNRLTLDVEGFEDRYDAAVEKVHSASGADRAEAARFMREIIAKDQLFWQPHLMLALAVRESEGDAAALTHLTNAVRLRPNDAEIRDLIAAILRKQGRAAEAVEHLRAVVTLKPRDIAPVINLATAMRDANLFDECRQVCQAALQMVPNHPDFTRILASLPPPKAQQN